MDSRKRREIIHFALDLGFSDYGDPGENVREDTLLGRLDAIEEAVAIKAADEAICFSLWSELGAEHPSAEVYVLDFPSDLRASLYLLLGGYYRQAILEIRNWMEMRLLGVYYGFVQQTPAAYQDWKSGRAQESDRAFGRPLIHRLFQRSEFHKADRRVGVKERLRELYSELSAFTHGAGLELYDLQARADNVPRYNEASVDLWLDLLRRTFGEITYCLWLAYRGRAFSYVRQAELVVALTHLPDSYRAEVEAGTSASGP